MQPLFRNLLFIDECGNFFRKVFFFLFNAFTQLETGKAGNFSILGFQQFTDGQVAVPDILLVNQTNFFLIFVDTAHNHLGNDVFRFAFVPGLLGQDLFFMLQFGSRNYRTV